MSPLSSAYLAVLVARSLLARQRGYGLIVVLLILSVALSTLVLTSYNPTRLALDRAQKTSQALANAKEALVGYAVRRGDIAGNARPGEFPCPDRNNDGFDNDGSCSAGALGRIPWRTLGIPEPRDSDGETLWYAVAGPFRTRPSNNNPLNSDVQGTLIVRAADGVTPLTTQAVAVIFAPGAATGAQDRATVGSALCATTLTVLLRTLCATNYVEASAGINNAITNGPFIAGTLSNTYNDRLMFITASDVMPTVEMRVGQELATVLEAYRANSRCKCYPWAANFSINLATAARPSAPSKGIKGLNRGRLPLTARPQDWTGIAPLPQWFMYNNWHNVIYYTVAKQNTNGGGYQCKTCGSEPMLSVGGTNVSALFFTPGTPPGVLTRPSNSLTAYLDDGQNRDGNDDIYVLPVAIGRDRDRLKTLVAAASIPSDVDDDDNDN